jgi:hypothetical protein
VFALEANEDRMSLDRPLGYRWNYEPIMPLQEELWGQDLFRLRLSQMNPDDSQITQRMIMEITPNIKCSDR